MPKKPKAKMPVSERAKQFMPFAALKGLYEAYAEKEKIYADKKELSDDMLDELNEKLSAIKVGQEISVAYYKDGEYLKQTGLVSDIDTMKKFITIVDNKILFDDLYEIEINWKDD